MRRYAWDRGVDYQQMRRRLVRFISSQGDGLKAGRRRAYAAVLLIQLVNGSRVEEAAEAAYKFAISGKNEVEVKVRKRRDASRKMVIPKEARAARSDLREAVAGLDEEKAIRRLRYGAQHTILRYFGLNTHSLRYAFISHLGKKGIAPQLIAKITGHAKLDYILHYTQAVEAEKILREVVERG